MDDIENMKYAELQKLAKKYGIKANMKSDKLIKALKEYQAAHSESEHKKECVSKEHSPQEKALTPKHVKPSRTSKSPRLPPASGTPKGTPRSTSVKTPSVKRLSRTPLSGVKRLSSRPATPGLPAESKKSMTPKQGTPSSSKRKVNQQPQKSSEKRRSSGRKRSNTYTLPEGTVPSPTVKEMMDSMKEGMSKDELKNSIQEVLNKNSKSSVDLTKPVASGIPRFAVFAMKKKAEAQKKTITPGNKDWAKIHQKQFDKMDSIDVYLEKKRKRTESISASVKKARLLAEQTKAAVNSLKSCMSPNTKDAKAMLFKTPVPHAETPFVPKVTSTAKMNTNFSAMKSPATSRTNTPKTAPVKEPVKPSSIGKENIRKSPRIAPSKKSLGTVAELNRKSMGISQNRKIAVAAANRKSLSSSAANRKSLSSSTTNTNRKSTANVETKKDSPFKLGTSLNQTLPISQQKQKFDLKASLARPMTWKPHTGKVKPFQQGNLYSQKAGAYRVDPKNINIKVQNKDDRRVAMKSRQADKRLEMQMKRRGINA